MVLRRDRYDPAKNNRDVSVRFVGLWDTVAAYGLPQALRRASGTAEANRRVVQARADVFGGGARA